MSYEGAENIALPSRVAMKIGKRVTGFEFVLYTWLAYAEAKIIDAILDPNERFIIVNVPPRSGKTTFSGVFLPAWYLGMFPDKRVMFTSYSDDFSVKFGRAVRTILDRFGRELFGVTVDRGAQSASDWQMQNSFGGMLSTGVGGSLTGYGGNLIIVDDVLKNIQEARSATVKKGHMEWFDTTLRTRLEPGGTILITATRWAEDDISGTVLERQIVPGYQGDRYELIDFPALAEPGEYEVLSGPIEEWRDELGRKIGESISPERYTEAQFIAIRNTIDSFMWSCLYQQRPSSPTGGMFPAANWRYWNAATLPHLTRKVRAWDLAASEGGGDFTVGSLFARGANGDLYLLERERFQLNAGAVEDAVLSAAKRDGYSTKVLIEQERAGAGKALIAHYQRLLAGYVVEGVRAEGSKEQRAAPYSAMQQRSRVWLPEGAAWLDEWRKEHQAMMGDGRRPRHDDQIDTGGYAASDLLGQAGIDLWVPGEGLISLVPDVEVDLLASEIVGRVMQTIR